MNLTWHIIVKDLRRMRFNLAVWVALLVVKIALFQSLFSTAMADAEMFERRHIGLGLFAVLEGLVAYLLTATLVLEDSPTGSRVFWMTRPLSGGRLLVAKLFGAGLAFVILPVLVALPWWLACGLGGKGIAVAALWAGGQQLLVIVPGIVVAALTGQMGRFLGWTLALLTALPLVGVIMIERQGASLWAGLGVTRLVLALSVGAITGIAAMLLQYRTRRSERSRVLALTGLGVALVVAIFWPRDLSAWYHHQRLPALAGTESITFALSGAALHPTKDEGADKAGLWLRFKAAQVPVDLGLLKGRVEVEFRWADGSTLQRSGELGEYTFGFPASHALNLVEPVRDEETEQRLKEMREAGWKRMAAQGLPPPEALAAGEALMGCWLKLTPEEAARFAAEAPACTFAVRIAAGHPVKLLEIPLVAEREAAGGGMRLKLLRLDQAPVTTQNHGRENLIVSLVWAKSLAVDRTQLFLLDRTIGRAQMVDWTYSPQMPMPSVLSLQCERRSVWLAAPALWRNDRWVDRPEWRKTSTLAAVGVSPEGSFDREIKTERLILAVPKP